MHIIIILDFWLSTITKYLFKYLSGSSGKYISLSGSFREVAQWYYFFLSQIMLLTLKVQLDNLENKPHLTLRTICFGLVAGRLILIKKYHIYFRSRVQNCKKLDQFGQQSRDSFPGHIPYFIYLFTMATL